MSWALMHQQSPATMAPQVASPFSRVSIDRDGYFGGSKKINHNAALSALTLIAFLFFLNLLQQQISSGQQQTLLFTVNNTSSGRRRREAAAAPESAHNYDAEQVETFQQELRRESWSEDPKGPSSSTPMPELQSPTPAPAPPTGDTDNEWQQLATWMHGMIPTSKLPPKLAQVLSDCRDIISCILHRATVKYNGRSQPFLEDHVVKAILASVSEFGEIKDIDEACEDLLEMASNDCDHLAQTFSNLLPNLLQSQQREEHDHQDF